MADYSTPGFLQPTLPQSIAADKQVADLTSAIEEKLLEIDGESCYTLLLSRLDELGEGLVDELAWQYHVDFYDNTAPLSVKRDLVRNAIKWHMKKGTPYAVKAVLGAAFKSCELVEWFDYNAQPYHFKIEDIGESMPSPLSMRLLMDAVEKVKNTRSWCDGLQFRRDLDEDLYLSLIVKLEKEIKITQVVTLPSQIATTLYGGGATSIYRKVVIEHA